MRQTHFLSFSARFQPLIDVPAGIDLLQGGISRGAFHNSSDRYDPPKCHPDTRLAVLEAIMAWIKDGQKTSFIMWLHGSAGAGKSAIAQTIADMCHRLGILAASFFWARAEPSRNDETRLIASLAYQLIVAIPEMRVYVTNAIENDPSLLARSLEAQMESLIVKPLQKAFPRPHEGPGDHLHPKLIILDGLDECGSPRAQRYILKVISTAVQKFPIPLVFLIASRPEQEIRDSFSAESLNPITTRLALDETYHPDDDIRLFLVQSFDALKRTHAHRSLLPPIWPTAGEVNQLVVTSSGQFIYAATVVKFIRSPRHKPDERLKIIFGLANTANHTPFADLDALYHHIFSSVEDLPRALELLSFCFLIDTRITFPRTADNLEWFLWYESGDLQLILMDLRSVLDVPDIGNKNHELRVLHATLGDFLMNPARSGKFYLDKGKAHAQLTRVVLRYYREGHSDPEPSDYNVNCTVSFSSSHKLQSHSPT